MPPLTLAVLASVLQMHGTDATIASDNKGIEDLLAPIRGQLQQKGDSARPFVLARNYSRVVTYPKNMTGGAYGRFWLKAGGGGTGYLRHIN